MNAQVQTVLETSIFAALFKLGDGFTFAHSAIRAFLSEAYSKEQAIQTMVATANWEEAEFAADSLASDCLCMGAVTASNQLLQLRRALATTRTDSTSTFDPSILAQAMGSLNAARAAVRHELDQLA